MDNNDNREDPKVDWASYHESNNQPVDVGAFTALVRRVGGELTEIDQQSVSNSTKRALQIDKEKIIRELSDNKTPTASQQPVDTPSPKPPPVPPVAPMNPPVERATPPPPPMSSDSGEIPSRIDALERKLLRMESFNKAYQKARKVKRGASYKVSSNSAKGIIKDSELIAEYILLELAKGVKSITIRLDESSDTQ